MEVFFKPLNGKTASPAGDMTVKEINDLLRDLEHFPLLHEGEAHNGVDTHVEYVHGPTRFYAKITWWPKDE